MNRLIRSDCVYAKFDQHIFEPRYEKTCFCIFENKDADQLRNCAVDQRLCFRYTESTIPLLNNDLVTICLLNKLKRPRLVLIMKMF